MQRHNDIQETDSPIPLKGRVPLFTYQERLSYYFNQYEKTILSNESAQVALMPYKDKYAGVDTEIIDFLFPVTLTGKKRPFLRLPLVMGQAPRSKLEFNLRYQDTRIKLSVEDKWGEEARQDSCREDVVEIMEIVAIFLNTVGFNGDALWKDLTDNDLDALLFLVIGLYNPKLEEQLLSVGYQTNDKALEAVAVAGDTFQRLSLQELIRYQIFAGAIWWPNAGANLQAQFEKIGQIVISDMDIFLEAMLNENTRRVVFIIDDNGELVWDLLLVQRLLKENSNIHITIVVNLNVIANNANVETIKRCMSHPLLENMKNNNRLDLLEETNYRSAIDPLFCSDRLMELITSSDLVLIKGVSFFETIQGLPVDTYYSFVVHSHDSQICTGLLKGDGVLVKVSKGKSAYQYRVKTLKDLYPESVH